VRMAYPDCTQSTHADHKEVCLFSYCRNVLVIDCKEIIKQGRGSESKLVAALASQVGYFPQFQWAASFNNLIDIASVGLIGTKAGFATNLDVQIKQVRRILFLMVALHLLTFWSTSTRLLSVEHV
jgi:hypothetical protein